MPASAEETAAAEEQSDHAILNLMDRLEPVSTMRTTTLAVVIARSQAINLDVLNLAETDLGEDTVSQLAGFIVEDLMRRGCTAENSTSYSLEPPRRLSFPAGMRLEAVINYYQTTRYITLARIRLSSKVYGVSAISWPCASAPPANAPPSVTT